MRDFRPHEPEAIRGVEGARSMILSVFAVSPNLSLAIDRVLACDDRVIALTVSYRGRARGGRGEFVYLTGYVAEIEDGHWLSTSEFEPDEAVAMLARYREFVGR